MQTALISHTDCLLHQPPGRHPERPDRLHAVLQRIEASGTAADLLRLNATPIAANALATVHQPLYVDFITQLNDRPDVIRVDPDTTMNPGSYGAAMLAAGAVHQAVEDIIAQRYKRAFCAIRPPGHHAEEAAAMGFCLFNNIAVGAAQALTHTAIKRVAVLDFDVHHGNGTVAIFKDRPEVLVCSSFQHPHYPMRYYDIERPNIVNTPLPAGTSGQKFRAAIERDWLPALERHRPDFIFVSAGFDAHAADPLSDLLLHEDDYQWITELIVRAADHYSKGRLVSALEGGYDLEALAASALVHVQTMLKG